LERAHEELIVTSALPAPATPGTGDARLQWYLEPWGARWDADPPTLLAETPASGSDLTVHLEPLPSRGFDRAAAFCTGGGSDLERSAYLCLAEASLAARAPAHAPHVRRAYAAHLAAQLGKANWRDEAAVRALQSAPERGVFWRKRTAASDGARLWFDHLEAQSPRAELRFGRVASTALALAATHTAGGALRWSSEPDLLDVVRSSFGHSREDVARFWDGFAQKRMLLAGGAEPAWVVRTSSLPRHLALPRPLAPTGSGYVVVEFDRPVLAMALRATCEAPVSYVWSVARYAADGRHLSTLQIPFQESQRVTEQRIVELDGVQRAIVSGTNLGGVDLAHPFDPDHEPFEPHGCSIYLAEL
jgi:hypothetical protein